MFVAMDETHGWSPPDLGRLDLAVLPIGVFEHHPYTARAADPPRSSANRRSGRPAMPGPSKQVRSLAPRRAVLLHVEEMDPLSHGELVRLGASDGWEPAWDGLVVDA